MGAGRCGAFFYFWSVRNRRKNAHSCRPPPPFPPPALRATPLPPFTMQRSKLLKLAKGFRGRAKNCVRVARERVERALQYATRDRRAKKRDFRSLWIARIGAGAREHGVRRRRGGRGRRQCGRRPETATPTLPPPPLFSPPSPAHLLHPRLRPQSRQRRPQPAHPGRPGRPGARVVRSAVCACASDEGGGRRGRGGRGPVGRGASCFLCCCGGGAGGTRRSLSLSPVCFHVFFAGPPFLPLCQTV